MLLAFARRYHPPSQTLGPVSPRPLEDTSISLRRPGGPNMLP